VASLTALPLDSRPFPSPKTYSQSHQIAPKSGLLGPCRAKHYMGGAPAITRPSTPRHYTLRDFLLGKLPLFCRICVSQKVFQSLRRP
jgi:hypothetical protein